MPDNVQTEELVSTENFIVWVSHEPDDEIGYHLELGQVTVHLFAEEWNELLALVARADGMTGELTATDNFAVAVNREPDADATYDLELTQATIYFVEEDWNEFLVLIESAQEELRKRGQ